MSRFTYSPDDDWLSPQAYLAWERASEQRHEYEAGRVIATAGASANHNRIVGNLHVGEKLFAYQRLPSLQDYLIVHQEVARVEHFSRQGAAWLYQRYEGLEGQVALPGLGLSLALAALYQRVDFSPQASLPPSP